MNWKEIQERNYKATCLRGLITPQTTESEFISKIFAETHELYNYHRFSGGIDRYELADIIIVCLNIARHFDIDIETAISEKTAINEKRAREANP